MKSLAFAVIVVMTGLAINAAGLSAPIDGYEIVNVTWTIDPKIPGGTPLNLTGTVQEVWDQIKNLPGYQAPQKGLAGRQGPMPHPTNPPRHNLTNGYLICNNRPSASRLAVLDGIYHLRDIPGRPGMPPGPGACGRVSCSYSSAIYWCNDNDHAFSVDSYRNISDGANDIELNCGTHIPVLHGIEVESVSGQIFFPDKWNVVITRDRDHC